MISNERKTNIREYAEEMEVTIADWQKSVYGGREPMRVEGEVRLVINALNKGGYNGTEVDLLDVIEWVRENKPELLEIGYKGKFPKETENEG